jgi:hypothetical protein
MNTRTFKKNIAGAGACRAKQIGRPHLSKKTSYLLQNRLAVRISAKRHRICCCHVPHDLARSAEIRRDPSTATPAASSGPTHPPTNPSLPPCHRSGKPCSPDMNRKMGASDKTDTIMLPVYIPACTVSPVKKEYFI